MVIAIQLTDAGAQVAKGQLSTAGESMPGATAHMDGNDVTFVGPVSSFVSDTATSPANTTPPADTTPAPETPAAPQEQSGPLGTVFTPADSLGMYGTVQVRVDKVTYGVKVSDPYASQPAKGNQLVGLQVWAKAERLTKSGTASVNTTAFTLLGSDGQGYDTMNSIATYAATFKGEFEFAGQHESGTLMTEMPKGVTVTAVKYTGGDEPFTWNVAKLARVPTGAGQAHRSSRASRVSRGYGRLRGRGCPWGHNPRQSRQLILRCPPPWQGLGFLCLARVAPYLHDRRHVHIGVAPTAGLMLDGGAR